MKKNRIINYRPRSVAYAAAPRQVTAELDAAKARAKSREPERGRGRFSPVSPIGSGMGWVTSLVGRGANVYNYSDTPTGWIDAAQHVWASNCIEARQKAIAAAPLKLYQKPADPENEEPKVVKSHAILDLLESVNPITLDKSSFHETGARQLAIHGAWHTYKVRGINDKPKELYILPGHLIVPEPDYEEPANWLLGFRYAGVALYPPEDVIRIYYPRDDDPLYARSPTSRAVKAINRYGLSDLAQEAIDKHGGQGGGVITPGYDVLSSDFDRFKAEWEAIRSDPNNAGRDLFLSQGFDYKQGVLTAVEQQREERSMRLVKEIMAAYNVPPSLAGDYTDASVLANAAQQSTNFWELWVLPELRMISEALTVKLLWADWPETRAQGYYLAYDVSEIPALQEDKKESADVDETRTRTAIARIDGGLSSINDGRAYLGMEPVKDERADSIFFATMARAGLNEDGTPLEEQPEPDKTAEGDGAGDGNGDQTGAGGLNATQLSNVRQAVNQFASGKIDEEQARALITMSAPGVTEEQMAVLLKPAAAPEADPEAEAPAEPEETGLTPQEVTAVLAILEAQSTGVASEDAAAALVSLTLPDVDEETIRDIVTPEAMDPAEDMAEGEQDDPGAEPVEGEADAVDADPMESELDAAIAEAEGALGGAEPATGAEEDAAKAEPGSGGGKGKRNPDGIVRDNSGKFSETPGGGSNFSQLQEMAAQRRAANKGKKKGGKKKAGAKKKKAPLTDEQKQAKKKERVQKKLDKINELIKSLEGKEGVDDLRKKLQALAKRAEAKIADIDSGLDALKAERPEPLAVPIVDPVGLLAISAESGEPLGVVERVARYGMQGEGEAAVKATKANPVLYVDGRPLLASTVRVVVDSAVFDAEPVEPVAAEPSAVSAAADSATEPANEPEPTETSPEEGGSNG